MELTFQTSGNSDLKVLNSSLSIKSGDLMAVVYLSISYNSSEIIGTLYITKKESNNLNKYQDIVPLEIDIEINEQIKILLPTTINMYIGGKSYFQEISLEDLTNIPINITLTPNDPSLQIIGNQNTLIFKENCNKNTFRLQISENANTNQKYYLNVNIPTSQFSSLFSLPKNIIAIKLANKPNSISPANLSYSLKYQISSKTLDFNISNFSVPVFFYYQIYQKLESGTLELSFEEIIKKADENQVNSQENIIGVLFCSDTWKICSGQATGLEITEHFFKGVAITPWGVQSNINISFEFEPYRKKKLFNYIKKN